MISSLRSGVKSGRLGSTWAPELRLAGGRVVLLPDRVDEVDFPAGLLLLPWEDFEAVVLALAIFDLPEAGLLFGGAFLAGEASGFLAML